MTVTHQTVTINAITIEISQDKFSQAYKVTVYEYGKTIETRYYNTLAKAKRRFNTLRKQIAATEE